jgi:hypothetical protein
MAKCPATQLSLEWCRLQKWIVDIAERSIPMKPFPIKKDLFGLFDLVAIEKHQYRGLVVHFIQTTSATHRSHRLKKMEAAYDVMSKLVGPGIHSIAVDLHSWKKAKNTWVLDVQNACEVTWDHKTDCIVTWRCLTTVVPTMKALRAKERAENGERAGVSARSC